MELRNRILSEEEQKEEKARDEIDVEEEEMVPDSQDMQVKSISSVDSDDEMEVDDIGGFLGDFEEIDEDEAIERFISQNHTPAISTRETPETSKQAEDSSDGEDSFEPILEKDAKVGPLEPPIEQTLAKASEGKDISEDDNGMDKQIIEQPGDQIVSVLPTNGPNKDADVPEWKLLEDQFRERFIPKLPPGQFFQAEIYRKYSVVSALATKSLEAEMPAKYSDPKIAAATAQVHPVVVQTSVCIEDAPASKSAPAPAPAPTPAVIQQKPSSLRTINNNINSGNNVAGLQTQPSHQSQDEDGPAASTRARTAAVASKSKQDDVVGALLGVMQSPTKEETEPQPEQRQQPPSSIPSDMLAAMMAIDGIDVSTKRPAVSAADPPNAGGTQRQMAKELASRLPKGYSGPFSQLTMEEHMRYLSLVQRARHQGKDQTELQRLKQRVESEQKEFRLQIKEKTLDHLRMIEPWVETASKRFLSKQRDQALDSYPRLYVPARVTAIKPIGSGYIPLVYKKTLFQRGVCFGVREKLPEQMLGDPWADNHQDIRERPVMTRDPHVRHLAQQAQADIALSDSALAALLTLQKMHMHDVLIPLEVVSVGDRRLVIVDRPLVVGRSATPRKLRQLVFDAAVRLQMVERNSDNKLALGPSDQQSQDEEPDASYTLWEFGDTRLLVRCSINGFSGDGASDSSGSGSARTTVTLASKLEYFAQSSASEVALAASGNNGMAAAQAVEDTTECDRLAWWLAAFLRGSPSQVWVTHVLPGAQPARVSRLACTDLFPPNVPQPPTHALRDVLAELSRLLPGKYMLQHRRSAWDATILRAVDDSATGAGMDLANELDAGATATAVATTASYVDADYVPPVWHGLPGQIPWTYPPADLAAELSPHQQTQQHKKRRTGARANKRNKNKKH